MAFSSSVLVYVNGARRQIDGEAALQTVLTYLRQVERLTGTKLGCGEGGCGACTVLLSTFDRGLDRVVHRAVNACLLPLASCDGAAITTIEAVGNRKGALAPLQQALINKHGSQCGFCTPGIVMSMFALLRENAANRAEHGSLTDVDVENNFDGNLCRCTGYRPILDAFKGLVAHEEDRCSAPCVLGEACCKRVGAKSCGPGISDRLSCGDDTGAIGGSDDSFMYKEYIFPPELVKYVPGELNIAESKWIRPVTLQRFVELKQKFPAASIIVGNTELGIECKFKGLAVSTYICASHVPELIKITERKTGVEVGASVTWTQLSRYIDRVVQERKYCPKEGVSKLYELGSLQAVQKQLRLFAGKQVRNVAAIGGNIITASPISDVNPIWIAAGASFVIFDCSTGKERKVAARDFFVSYRKVDLSTAEILLKIVIPWNRSAYDIVSAFKVSRRRDDDIAIVSAGIRIHLQQDSKNGQYGHQNCVSTRFHVSDIVVAYGGLGPKTVTIPEVEESLRGKPFDETSLQRGLEALSRATVLPMNVPGGMPEFRQCLAVAFLFKSFVRCANIISRRGFVLPAQSFPRIIGDVGHTSSEHLFSKRHGVSQGIQIAEERGPESPADQTGRSVPHVSAGLQVSGQAKYLDDIAPVERELQAALILSSEAHARILSLDYSTALNMPGVHKVVTSVNVRGSNRFGPRIADELCFVKDMVTTVGQVIGIVTADTVEHAKLAAKAVIVSYKKLHPIVTIEEAIEANSYAKGESAHSIESGNAEAVIDEASKKGLTVGNTVRIGAQEHWYLEPQGTLAIPEEGGEMIVIASTQSPSKTQEIVAKVLGESMHKITCKVKRLGGGFGGKESRSLFLSAAVAVAAQATSRPVRLILDRDTDMLTSGTRHAFLAKYKAAYEPSGRISAVKLQLYLNMGNSSDLSIPVLDRALLHAQNCYDIPNVHLTGLACYTHTPSSTAFRGFGGPQGMLVAEDIVENVAIAAKKPSVLIRDLNLYGKYGNSNITPYGMSIETGALLGCWEAVLRDSKHNVRRRDVDVFNKENKFRKRGIAAIPTMFGISFTFKTYNQAGALVHIFHGDGSVLISHGGVEMGQGLHTKICQVAASELAVPLETVFISETATDKVPNTSPTAASSSSDMYGMAVKNACAKLNHNLQGSRRAMGPNSSWTDVVSHAWYNRVSLSATGFYATPELDALNLEERGARGRPFYYFTNGAAVSEVEVDVLTGETILIRTDIAMDVGRSLNPAIDTGQIEGAFIQGLGWCTMEEVVRGASETHRWISNGHTHTLGPSTYKIPGFSDIPKDFRVRVLKTRNEKDTIHSSKAIGEPPLFLASSVFFAIRDAIRAARTEQNMSQWFELDSPASVERIRLACGDAIGVKGMKTLTDVKPHLSL